MEYNSDNALKYMTQLDSRNNMEKNIMETSDQIKSEIVNKQSLSMFSNFFTSKVNEYQWTGLSNLEMHKIILDLWDKEKNTWILKKSNQNKQKIYIRKRSILSDFEKFFIEELKKSTESNNNDEINSDLLKEKWENIKKNKINGEDNINVNELRQLDVPNLPSHLDIDAENGCSNFNKATIDFMPPSNQYSQKKTDLKPSSRFECNVCRREFDSRPKLKYHEKTMHAENANSCHICSQSFTSPSNLRRHVRNVHKINDFCSSNPKSKERFWCKQCSYKGRDNHDLRNHQRKHTGERPFSCEKCTFSFRKKSDLNKHKQVYCKGAKNKCGKCQKNFFSRKQYYQHCLWSETCGSLSRAAPGSKPGNSAEEESPEIIRFNMGKDTSLVGINCEELININPDYFSKRSKKSRCGVCLGCSTDQDCGACRGCLLKQSHFKVEKGDSKEKLVRSLSSKRGRAFLCLRRQCLKPVAQYDVRKSVRSQLVQQNHVLEPAPSLSKTDTIFKQYSHLPILDETFAKDRVSQYTAMIPLVEDVGAMVDIVSEKILNDPLCKAAELQESFVSDTEVVSEEVISVDLFDSTSINQESVIVCSNDIIFHDDVTIGEKVFNNLEDESKVFNRVIVMNEEVVQN